MSFKPITKDYLLSQLQNFDSNILQNVYINKMDNFVTFRGQFDTWNDVPTNVNLYNEDIKGNKAPFFGDYIIVNDPKNFGTVIVTVNSSIHNALNKYLAEDISNYESGTLITSEIEQDLNGVDIEVYICYDICKFVYLGEFLENGKGNSTTYFGWKPYLSNIEGLPFTQKQIENLNRDYSPPPADEIEYDNSSSGMSATNVQDAIDEFAQSFQDGCDSITQAVTAQGRTPVSNGVNDIVTAINDLKTIDPVRPIVENWSTGYVNSSGGWTWEDPLRFNEIRNYMDVYQVYNGYKYNLFIGEQYGNRFRAGVLTVDTYNRILSNCEKIASGELPAPAYSGSSNWESTHTGQYVEAGVQQILNLRDAQVLPFYTKVFTVNMGTDPDTGNAYPNGTMSILVVSKEGGGNPHIKTYLGIQVIPS